jgi:hypothetical protein
MSGHCDPEYPDSNPESPGHCYSSDLGPESLDPYVRSIRTYTRSIRVPFTQRLVFYERGYKYPSYPFISPSLAHFEPEHASKQKESSLISPLPFLSDFLRGIK